MQGHFALARPDIDLCHTGICDGTLSALNHYRYWRDAIGVLVRRSGAGRWRNRTFDPHLRRTKQGQTLGEVEFVQVIGKNFWLDGGNVVEITFPPVT